MWIIIIFNKIHDIFVSLKKYIYLVLIVLNNERDITDTTKSDHGNIESLCVYNASLIIKK